VGRWLHLPRLDADVTPADIEDWLASLGVTLWGDWWIDDPKRRKLAAEWFADQAMK
jgi:hypothetical protein